MPSHSFILFISIFLLFVNIISTTGQNEIRDIQALIDYDKQLELLQQQYTGKLSENVGFSLLYHMREDRWKQGGDWEALFYTNNAIEYLQTHNQSENNDRQLACILQDETFDNITSNTLKILNDSLPQITRIELFDALKVHKIRLLTILGRYTLAQKLSSNLSLEHIEIYGRDSQLLDLHRKLQDLDISNEEVLDLLKRMKYLMDYRALLYFISGQAWLSSGDAFTSVKWFEKAIQLNPCLHQAYYQLSQAVAASPHNNPRNRNDEKSLLIDESSIDRNDASRHQYLRSLANKLENLLYLIHLDPHTQQVVLLRRQQISDNKNTLTLLTYFASFLPFLSSSTSPISGNQANELPVNRNIHCVFGDELQYFHTLLQYSQVSNNMMNDDGEEDAEVDMADVLDHSNFKITLNADYPAAFAQQPPSTGNPQTTQSSKPLPHVSRDYVQVVQAALYWSLFTITDALAPLTKDNTTETLALAFFYLQQARTLERFRAHHPLYALYSAEESQRQAAHILRAFTADYYPRPVYPETMPMTAKEKAFFRDAAGVSATALHQDTAAVESIFAHDLKNETLQDQTKVEEEEDDEDDDRFYGSSIQRPVFIVGFFRSGSTLLETLLTQRDPRIWGLGEHSAFATQMHRMQDDMMRLAEQFDVQRRQYATTTAGGRVAEDDLRHMQETMFRAILRKHAHVIDDLMVSRCTQYVRKRHQSQSLNHTVRDTSAAIVATTIPSQCTRIVDKMLLNYRNLGLIHLLFPQATVLHTMRDPVDTMWSCMTHRFGDEAAFTLDVKLLVSEYLLYLSVMQHFRRTLPPRPPVWGHLGRTNDTEGDATQPKKKNHQDTNNKNKNKNNNRIVSWDNLALCDTDMHQTTTKGRVRDTFPLLCHQQRQLDRQRKSARSAKVPLRPLIDVRYDTVVTRSSLLLKELQHLLQLPHPNRTLHPPLQPRDTSQQENQTKHQQQDTDTTGDTDTNECVPTDEPAPIRTASFLQVRRPVNTAAQGKWLRYAPWLKYNLLPLWHDTLYNFANHPLYELLVADTDQDTDMNNPQEKKTKKRKQQQQQGKKTRNAWKELVPFSTTHDDSGSSSREGPTHYPLLPAMNWLGDEHYPYADRLTTLAAAVDRVCSAT